MGQSVLGGWFLFLLSFHDRGLQCNILWAHLSEVISNHGTQSLYTICHVAVSALELVETGMNSLCTLLSEHSETHFPLLQERHNMIFDRVQLRCDGRSRKLFPVELKEPVNVSLCMIFKNNVNLSNLRSVTTSSSLSNPCPLNRLWHLEYKSNALPNLLATACAASFIWGHLSEATFGRQAHIVSTLGACVSKHGNWCFINVMLCTCRHLWAWLPINDPGHLDIQECGPVLSQRGHLQRQSHPCTVAWC